MSTTTRIRDTCFTYHIRLSSQVMTRRIYSRFTFCWTTRVKCCMYVCKPPESKYTFGPRFQKNTLTFSAQTHGISIFPEVFETFLRFSTWKWGDPTHRQINSCTCLPARAVATSSVSSYSNQKLHAIGQKKKGQDWQLSRSTSLPRAHSGRWGTHRRCRGVWRRRPSCSKAVPALFLD